MYTCTHLHVTQAIQASKDSGSAEAVSKAGTDAQREAKHFIAELMGGDEVAADGGDPTAAEVRQRLLLLPFLSVTLTMFWWCSKSLYLMTIYEF